MRPGVAAPVLFLFTTGFVPAVCAQDRVSPGPLMQAVDESVSRLALAQSSSTSATESQKASEAWSRVIGLAPGTKIVVETRGGIAASRTFVDADESGLIVKVPELSDVLQRLTRQDIVAIKTAPRRRGSVIGAAIGATGGFVLGYASAVHLAYKPCNGSCSEEKALMGLSLVGFPIGGALLGYQAKTRIVENVIYRTP